MEDKDSHKSPKGDFLGVAPFGEAVKVVAQGVVKTAQELFNAVCLPAASEAGFMLRDKMRAWRAANLEKIALKSQRFLTVTAEGAQLCAHPRVVFGIIEHGSSAEDDFMQEKWAGLLASACTPDGTDESNLMFIDLLNRLTSSQARLLDHACQKARKVMHEDGRVFAHALGASRSDLSKLMGIEDVQRIDREFTHLRILGLINDAGITENYQKPNERRLEQITPRPLALYFYVRCQGSRLSPKEFFNITDVVKSARRSD